MRPRVAQTPGRARREHGGLDAVSEPQSMFDLLGEQDEDRAYFQTGGIGRSRDFYTGSAQYERELASIFGKRWLPVDHVSRFRETGSYAVLNVGDRSVLIVRGDHEIQAFHNF